MLQIDGQMDQAFRHHERAIDTLVQYLRSRARIGFNSKQFEIYRDNYFYRTATTIEAIARVALAAVCEQDFEAASMAAKNLFEETGEGISARNHRTLLQNSHNIHALRLFNLPWSTVEDAQHSTLLLDATLAYRRNQASLYHSSPYTVLLAASFAQEHAALGMLTLFYETLFLPYQGYYVRGEFDAVSQYFLLHIGGMEQEHSINARNAVLRRCTDVNEREAALHAMVSFLRSQAQVWIALADRLSNAESDAEPVRPRWHTEAQ